MDTRKTLEDEVLSWLDEAGDTSTTQTNVRNALISAHQRRLTEDSWNFMLWPEPDSFTLDIGVTKYTLHSEFLRGLWFVNRTRGILLREKSSRHLRPDYTDESNKFVLDSRAPVLAQPTSETQVRLASTSDSDTGGAQGVLIRGMTASGMVSEIIYAAGGTPAISTNYFIPNGIVQLSKFGTWSGTASVSTHPGGDAIVFLPPSEIAKSYQQMRLLWTPDQEDTIEYQFYRQPSPLEYDWSVPDIPFPFSKILVWDALLDLTVYDGQLDTSRREHWEGKQEALDLQMRQNFIEGQTVNAEPQEVHYIDDDV